MGLFKKRAHHDREAALANLTREAGEPLETAVEAQDLGLGRRPIRVGLTETAILWALRRDPSTVMRMRFDRISNVQQKEAVVGLTERDPDYAQSLNDPLQPLWRNGFHFQLAGDEAGRQFSRDLNTLLFRHSPFFERRRTQIQRFKQRQDVPVVTWQDCPFCGNALSSKIEGAASCADCERCFSDADLNQSSLKSPATYGRVISAKPWAVVFEGQLIAKGKTNTWPYRLKGAAFGPPVVLDSEALEDGAAAVSGSLTVHAHSAPPRERRRPTGRWVHIHPGRNSSDT
jgi:hypothetical protein